MGGSGKHRSSTSEGEHCSSNGGAVLHEKMPFIDGRTEKSRSPTEGVVLQQREDREYRDAVLQGGRTPFIKKGRRTLFFK